LIYFHGVGEQKRYEEVSRLIDELELYEPKIRQVKDSSEHCLEFEPTYPGLGAAIGRPLVGYLPVSYDGKTEYRFYEAYYADLLAGGIRPTEVFLWLLKLSFRPVRILRTYWRELPRLRRATLLGDWDRNRKKTSSKDDKQNLDNKVTQLLDAYDKFELSNQPSQASNQGNFWHFVDALNHTSVQWNAWKWLLRFIWIQVILIPLILSALLTLGLAALGIFALIWQIPAHIVPISLTIVLGIAIFFVVGGLSAFLRNYVGDLYFWTTYEETSEKYQKREEILKRSCAYLSHVLADKNCDRVVLVGHSMGTTVAHDTILRMARNPFIEDDKKKQVPLRLGKIQHFVTLASVIDKVYYLFETVTTKSFNYSRILELLRKDIGNPPFSKDDQNQTPQIHWINFWDRADVASSPLYTPTNHVFNPYHVVDDYEVAGVCFPDPVSGHSDYFKNPVVLDTISKVLFDDEYNFVKALKPLKLADLPKDKNTRDTLMNTLYEELFIGWHEKEHKFTNWLHGFVILFPWLILFYWIFIGFRPAVLDIQFLYAALSYILFILLLASIDWFLRFRHRVTTKPDSTAQAKQKQQPNPVKG
jgi:hypothetical protein